MMFVGPMVLNETLSDQTYAFVTLSINIDDFNLYCKTLLTLIKFYRKNIPYLQHHISLIQSNLKYLAGTLFGIVDVYLFSILSIVIREIESRIKLKRPIFYKSGNIMLTKKVCLC